jgi:predicted DNA-binding transcriptional regulator AlpA
LEFATMARSKPHVPPLPAALHDHDARVLTVAQWAGLCGFSVRTAKRLLARGDGPPRVRLSAGRVGITVAAHKAWLEKRSAA